MSDALKRCRWWHRFFYERVPPNSQRFSNLNGQRLAPHQFFAYCPCCQNYRIGAFV